MTDIQNEYGYESRPQSVDMIGSPSKIPLVEVDSGNSPTSFGNDDHDGQTENGRYNDDIDDSKCQQGEDEIDGQALDGESDHDIDDSNGQGGETEVAEENDHGKSSISAKEEDDDDNRNTSTDMTSRHAAYQGNNDSMSGLPRVKI